MNFQGNGKSNQVNLEFPTLLHMGRRKIVTGGPEDSYAIVWKANNRHRTSPIKRIRLRYSEDERASKLGLLIEPQLMRTLHQRKYKPIRTLLQ